MFGRGDAEGAGWLVAQLGQGGKLGVDLLQFRRHRSQQALAGLRRRDAARGAGQQPQAEPLLQPADRMRERGL